MYQLLKQSGNRKRITEIGSISMDPSIKIPLTIVAKEKQKGWKKNMESLKKMVN